MPEPQKYTCEHETEVKCEDRGKYWLIKEVCKKCGKVFWSTTELKIEDLSP